ncbi:hypothetical protein L2Y94_09590 [Luteibacter aegosomatis]|uniref:hypothetical protein n=1 Tax=Luteibacter aegosomatis TaxID=2911537 RepID=UPI001FFAE2B9|nr:hypothetical protein [Luteibacter aegosomatis]UPG87582.1 hypothetical protein L2Y94_09590 [Luteibacter aegosomatis]
MESALAQENGPGIKFRFFWGARMAQGNLKPNRDKAEEKAKEVINLLAGAKRYRSRLNPVGAGKKIVPLFRWCLPPAILSAIVATSLEIWTGQPQKPADGPVLYWAEEILSMAALTLSFLALAVALFLLWWRREGLTENEAHHLRTGYLLHEQQVEAIAVYPLPVLHSVSRYFEHRHLSGMGIHVSFIGWSGLTLPTVALVVTSVKQLSDLHAFGVGKNGDLVSVVWLAIGLLVFISVMMRWFSRKEEYQRGLLADAIAMATERECKAAA